MSIQFVDYTSRKQLKSILCHINTRNCVEPVKQMKTVKNAQFVYHNLNWIMTLGKCLKIQFYFSA